MTISWKDRLLIECGQVAQEGQQQLTTDHDLFYRRAFVGETTTPKPTTPPQPQWRKVPGDSAQ
jgi:hypothetical protein